MQTQKEFTLSLMLVRDITVVALMIVLPSLVVVFSTLTFLTNIDEMIYVLMLGVVLTKLFLRLKVSVLLLILMVFIGYNLVLIEIRHLPALHILQVIITLKFMIYFYYYYFLPEWYKPILLKKVVWLLGCFVILTMCLAPLQLIVIPEAYAAFFQTMVDGRGINGVSLSSIYGSRSLFAQYTLFFVIIILSLKSNALLKGQLISSRTVLTIILMVMLFLSFSRKELALSILFLSVILYIKFPIKSLFLKVCGVGLALLFAVALFYFLFAEVNDQTIGNEDYIRFSIWRYGIDIFNYYFPLGSGPGTYGSVMSKEYLDVYLQFHVSQDILGWGDKEAAIYDVYAASIAAEYGLLGILFYLLLLYFIKKQPAVASIDHHFSVNRATTMLVISLLSLVFFAPVFTNIFGFLTFLFFGISHGRRYAR
jgi:hypothetical protein